MLRKLPAVFCGRTDAGGTFHLEVGVVAILAVHPCRPGVQELQHPLDGSNCRLFASGIRLRDLHLYDDQRSAVRDRDHVQLVAADLAVPVEHNEPPDSTSPVAFSSTVGRQGKSSLMGRSPVRMTPGTGLPPGGR